MNDPKIIEAVKNYYKKKSRYDESLQTKKKAIINNKNLSSKEKREKFQLMRIPCIHCRKPVGTLFIEKDRKLQAKCGATSKDKYAPCDLNIIIQKGNYETIPWAVELYDSGKEPDKDEIIKTKLNLFFQYSNEENTLATFDKIKKDYSENNKEYERYLNDLIEATPYLKNKKTIAEHTTVMTKKKYEIIQLIKQSKSENNKQLIKDAVEIYINDLLPMIDKDRSLKYSYYKLETDYYDEKKKKLVQNETSTLDTEFVIDTDPEIIQNTK
jgi:hypothetical protein